MDLENAIADLTGVVAVPETLVMRKIQRRSQRGLIESTDGRSRLLADNCHGHGAKPAGDQIVVRTQIGLDVFRLERHGGA